MSFAERYATVNKAWGGLCTKFSLPITQVEIGIVAYARTTEPFELCFDHTLGILHIDEEFLKKESLETILNYLPHELMHYGQWKEGFSTAINSKPPVMAANNFWLRAGEQNTYGAMAQLNFCSRNAMFEYDANRRLAERGLLLDYLKLAPAPNTSLFSKDIQSFYAGQSKTPIDCLRTLNWYVNFFCDVFRLYAPCKTEDEKKAARRAIIQTWRQVSSDDIAYALHIVSKMPAEELDLSRTLRCLFDENWNIKKKLPHDQLRATKTFSGKVVAVSQDEEQKSL